jgi:hypothetical protein
MTSTCSYCIVTGRHMVADEWSYCNRCKFPALRGEFQSWYDTEKCCPMCGEIAPEDIVEVRCAATRNVCVCVCVCVYVCVCVCVCTRALSCSLTHFLTPSVHFVFQVDNTAAIIKKYKQLQNNQVDLNSTADTFGND